MEKTSSAVARASSADGWCLAWKLAVSDSTTRGATGVAWRLAHSVAAAYVSWHAPASVASPRHGSASRAASVGHADSSAAIAGCEYSFAHAPNSRNRIALATRRISEAAFPAAAANDDDDEPAPASAHSALARATALATRRRANATAFAGSRTLATTRARPSTTHARRSSPPEG